MHMYQSKKSIKRDDSLLETKGWGRKQRNIEGYISGLPDRMRPY